MVNSELARTFAFYGGLLAVKTGLMSLLTVRHRISKKVTASKIAKCASHSLIINLSWS